MLQCIPGRVLILLFLFSVYYTAGNEKPTSLPHNSDNKSQENNKYRAMVIRGVCLTAAASSVYLGLKIGSENSQNPALSRLILSVFSTKAAIEASSAIIVDPEKAPKISVGLGLMNVASALVIDGLVTTISIGIWSPEATILAAFKTATFLSWGVYQIWAGGKALKGAKSE